MYKKILVVLLAVIMVFGLIQGAAFAANSMEQLAAQFPMFNPDYPEIEVNVFYANGSSGNGLNGPTMLWWVYDTVNQTGDVWMLVASNNAGKIATAARLGDCIGIIIDGLEKKAAPDGSTAYSLIKFPGMWPTGNENFDVSMNDDGSYKGGQWINGNLAQYFPQLVNVTYYDPAGNRIGADLLLSGQSTTVRTFTASTGYTFKYWLDKDENEYFSGNPLTVYNDLDLYAVEDINSYPYIVEYYYDGVIDTSKTISSSAQFESQITTYQDKVINGYKFDYDTAPITIGTGANIIEVYYIHDYSQTNPLSYTVEYYKDTTLIETDTFTGNVWVAAPQVLAVQPVSTSKYLPLGYKFDRTDPAVIPATIADEGVIKVYYVPDYSLVNELSYTVEYYKDTTLIEADTFTGNVWVAAPQVLAVQPVSTSKYLPLGYKFDRNDPDPIPATIADGGVIKVYYIKNVFTVTYLPGAKGLFAEEVYEDQQFGIETPGFQESLTNCELGWEFAGWSPEVAATVTADVIYVAQWVQIPYTVTFLLGDPNKGGRLDGQTLFTDLHYEESMPTPPHPYAKFSYKFLGWKADVPDADGNDFYPAPDYMNPTDIPSFPAIVTDDVIFTAQWAEINTGMQFPDKIPSKAHFDRWWGEYGIICFAASSTKVEEYSVMIADWFFDVFDSCTIGFGSPGKMDYEIVFTQGGVTLWQITGNGKKEVTNKDIVYEVMTCIEDGMYFTKDKDHDYGYDFGMDGTLQGAIFENPFGSGAKLAWLY
jgi:hypothetical protein